jgi:hypothetical protein
MHFLYSLFFSSPRNIGALLEYDRVGMIHLKVHTKRKHLEMEY